MVGVNIRSRLEPLRATPKIPLYAYPVVIAVSSINSGHTNKYIYEFFKPIYTFGYSLICSSIICQFIENTCQLSSVIPGC